MSVSRPQSEECPPYYQGYIDQVPGDDALAALEEQLQSTARLLAGVPESRAGFRYADDKWSVREVVGHVADAERIFGYRMLRFGRADATPLPGFDENAYMAPAAFERRPLAEVAAELAAVRQATLALVRGLPSEAWERRGMASGKLVSVRAIAWMTAGHERHHMRVIRERYLG